MSQADSQREVLGFLPHDADSTFLGQNGRVLVADLLVEEHVGVPVSPPHVGIRVGCTSARDTETR